MDIDLKEIAVYIILIAVVLIIAQHLNVVVSGSMEPVMYRGDIVVLEKANLLGIGEFSPADVKVGDIVVYDAVWHEGPVIHRVIDIGKINGTTVFKIKGDNNEGADPYWVTEKQITSRVLTFGDQPIIIPKIGYISIWIRGL
ncbi:signal peptidase I [Methanobrevibacter olleyae]|uniref:Signal peptidase I n=1 Tax=Methanobrevibacter olleyae TaxID=294671 RepID=A0A126R1T9_METOL|nr:signal peptidase I [Methanobrevibacter olleyae]AMK16251.1 signal peptidase I [Methanobrevibacter olleyae]